MLFTNLKVKSMTTKAQALCMVLVHLHTVLNELRSKLDKSIAPREYPSHFSAALDALWKLEDNIFGLVGYLNAELRSHIHLARRLADAFELTDLETLELIQKFGKQTARGFLPHALDWDANIAPNLLNSGDREYGASSSRSPFSGDSIDIFCIEGGGSWE